MAAAINGRPDQTLPTGTLTLLFTDIEGSTRLELALGTSRYGDLRERHRVLLRQAWSRHGGVEVGTEGDSFFVVFERPSAAVAAATDAQRALAVESWQPDGIVRVRMGMHTGEVGLVGGSYVGTALNRASRIASAAHGGQVVVSATTRALVGESLPEGTSLRDLGAHRLRDLPDAERLFQLEIDGLPTAFPPLRGQIGDSLPVQLTSFVGRDTELAAAERLLSTSRLLTLTGPGGTGKTRLAIALAQRAADMYPDGVVFVPLAPIDDPMLVPTAIARALGIAEVGARPSLDVVAEHLGNRQVLLVVDNFEQVQSAAPIVAELLRRAPNTTALLTSRAVLRVSGEQEYEVPGLPAPPDLDRLATAEIARLPGPLRRGEPEAIGRFEAVGLFVARARAVRPGFELDDANAGAVARIVARLHGMPLPIELAAARVKLLSPETILARLDDQLGLLASSARDLPERQRTIRGAIGWSVDLLTAPERLLFARLGVFVGGFEVESAVAVCRGDELDELAIEDGLAALVDQSIVRRLPGSSIRTELLEPIREFAEERLRATGDLEARRDIHARRYAEIAAMAEPRLAGDEQRAWLDRLDLDRDNLRAAIGWAIERPLPGEAQRLGFALWRFWQRRGYLDEAAARLSAILAAPWSGDDLALRAKSLEALGGIRYWQGRIDDAKPLYREATATWRSLDDRRELANALYNESYALAIDEPERALPMLEEARRIFSDLDDDAGLGNVLWALGTGAVQQGDGVAAEDLLRGAREHFAKAGERTMEAWADHMLGAALALEARYDEAEAAFDAGLRHFEVVGDISGIALGIADLSVVERKRGDLERAARLWLAGQSVSHAAGMNLLEITLTSFPGIWQAVTPADMPPGRYEELAREVDSWSLDDALSYAHASSVREK
jgi:predicted ATPase/class 3 adenylate cyclase